MAAEGTWQVVFKHPTGDQQLTLTLETTEGGQVSGSVANPSLGITVPITEGTADGDRFTFKAPMTTPVEVDITFDGAVDGDSVSGDVTIRGGGTFPFAGARARPPRP